MITLVYQNWNTIKLKLCLKVDPHLCQGIGVTIRDSQPGLDQSQGTFSIFRHMETRFCVSEMEVSTNGGYPKKIVQTQMDDLEVFPSRNDQIPIRYSSLSNCFQAKNLDRNHGFSQFPQQSAVSFHDMVFFMDSTMENPQLFPITLHVYTIQNPNFHRFFMMFP